MHDAPLVRRLERFGDLARRREGVAQGERSARERLGQRLAGHQLHHDVADRAGFLEPVDGGEGRMVHGGEHPRLAVEARQAHRVLREGLGEDLDGDFPPELAVAGPVHLSHTASAERSEHFVGAETRARFESH